MTKSQQDIAMEAAERYYAYEEREHETFLGSRNILQSIILAAMSKQGVAIQLTRGRSTVVSPEDADLSLFDWHCTSHSRAARGKSDYMHKVIGERMGLSGEIDHIDGNPLNNRRSNLRACTRTQNEANSPKHATRGNTSKYKGVSIKGGKWIAQIKYNGKVTYLGRFTDEEKAARAYDNAALKTFGEFARLNFPYAQKHSEKISTQNTEASQELSEQSKGKTSETTGIESSEGLVDTYPAAQPQRSDQWHRSQRNSCEGEHDRSKT